FRYQRGNFAWVPVVSCYPFRWGSAEWRKGRWKHLEGFLPSHIDELPPVWRAAQRPAGYGARLLLRQPQLCSAGSSGGALYAAPRVDTDLCSYHADGAVLRRGFTSSCQEGKETRRKSIRI